MSKREELRILTAIDHEKCLEAPIEELEQYENQSNLKFIKNRLFKAKALVNKEKLELGFSDAASRIQDKLNNLANYSVEALQEMLLDKAVQYRNFEKLSKEEIITILEDYYILEEIEKNNEE